MLLGVSLAVLLALMVPFWLIWAFVHIRYLIEFDNTGFFIDGHPAALAWMGSVCGHRTTALGVRKFGESGSVGDLYRVNGIDAAGIEQAVEAHTIKGAASPARETANP